MSVTQNAIHGIAKIVEEHLRCRTYIRGGVPLNKDQNKTWSDALVLLSFAWYDLIPTEATLTPRWLKPWLTAMSSTDVLIVAKTLKFMNEELVNTCSMFINYETFKQSLRASGCRVELISPAKRLIDRWSLYRDPADLRALRTCFSFILRINLKGLTDLEDQAKVRYTEIENSLVDDFLEREHEIMKTWFPLRSGDFIRENWLPQHGPGSTADEGNNILLKYRGFKIDDMVARLDLILGGTTMPYRPAVKLDRKCKVVFVPKAVDKLRTISMEPSTIQWYQQGVAHALRKYIVHHDILKRRIDLEDQTKSQELAYLGSIDGNLATIDLSDASDRVSWNLIRSWFSSTPVLPYLWMTRSRRVSIGEEVSEMRKYAPMGSALCFPVQCIVFSSIVEASIQAVGGSTRGSLYRVYGDDIVVETRYANEVIRRLTENGFSVNTSKSFYHKETHNFRESCGGEYFDGIDVTPLRLSRKFSGLTDGKRRSAPSIVALVDACNSFYSRLPSVRRYIIWDLLKLPHELRPVFDHSGLFGIFSEQPTNFHLPKPVYVKKYQQWYLRHGAQVSSREKGHGDEDLALYEHLRITNGRQSLSSPEDRVSVTLSRKPRLQWSVMKTPVELVANPSDKEDKKRG